MSIYSTPNHKLIAWFDKNSIHKYRPIISKELIREFGVGPFETNEVTKALFFTLKWYVEEFLYVLKNETDLAFYQGLFMLHEFSCEFQRALPNKSPIEEMSDQDFALYRRILKLALEQACDIPLVINETFTPNYIKVKEDVIEDLLYLGNFIFTCSNLLAEQHLVEDSVDLKFTKEEQYYFDHKHHYGIIIDEVMKIINEHAKKAVTGKSDFDDFVLASKKCLGVDYDKAIATIQLIHEGMKSRGGKLVLDEWFIYPKNLENLYGIPYEKGAAFYKGLTLSKDNKLPILEAVYRPHNINRYLFRPFLVWNVNGKDLTIVGDGIFIESIGSLCINTFGWNEYPIEWDNACFKTFIKKKVSLNDKILEDEAERILKINSIIYDRNITHLKKWNNQNINIDNESCGEIDFIIIIDNKVIIADSKHLKSRFDMNNFKNDYAAFETNKKSYNKTMNRKLLFLKDKIQEIQEHFQVLKNDRDFRINADKLEGIFIVNTPTFIMLNNEHRIYTIKDFDDLARRNYIDQVYQIVIEEDIQNKILFIKYPYFKKPDYLVFDEESTS